MSAELDARSRQILQAVVSCYIGRAEPVGSQTLSREYEFGISPATIRNIMSDLEEMGYLMHPHTSAGRIPTDLGYRFYVDNLKRDPSVNQAKLSELEQRYLKAVGELDVLLKQVSHMLSLSSNYVGLVLAPKVYQTVFKRIEFVNLHHNLVMVILITRSGIIQQKVIQMVETYPQSQLDKMAGYLNDLLKNLTLTQVRSALMDLMREEKNLYDKFLQQMLRESQQLLEEQEDNQIYLDGQMNILSQPEFSDVEKMRTIFRAFEEKNKLVQILDKCMEEEGVQIFIGSENRVFEMRDCSLVTATYKDGESAIGTLGVIGPTRMDYSAVIPIVEGIARTVSQLISKIQEG